MVRLVTLYKQVIAKLWMVGLVVLVFIALLISVMRAALPYTNQYQQQFSQLINERFNTALSMASLNGAWVNGGPLFIAEQVTLEASDQMPVELEIPRATLHVDLLGSVLALKPRFTSITLESPQLTLGDMSAVALTSSDHNIRHHSLIEQVTDLTDTARVQDAKLIFTPHYGQLPAINIAKMTWFDTPLERQLQVVLADKTHNQQPLAVVINLQGKAEQTQRGQAYIKADNWQWLANLKPILPQITPLAQASASFELWADFSAGQLDSMILALGENTLSWRDNNQIQELSITPEIIQWLPHKQGWLFEAKAIKPRLNNVELPSISVYANQNKDVFSASIERLNLAGIVPIASLFSAVDTATASLIERLNITGELEQIAVTFAQSQWNYQAKAVDLSMDNAGAIPGLSQLNGRISGRGNQGSFEFSMVDQRLDFGDYFKQPMAVTKLKSAIHWRIEDDHLVIHSPATIFDNNDLSTNLSWQLSFSAHRAPHLALLGGAEFFDIRQVENYLPHRVLSDNLIHYLSEGIDGGVGKEVEILWHGVVDDFPFKHHGGIFEVLAKIESANFQFHHQWQPLTNATLDLSFRNEGMTITSANGRVGQLPFEQLTASINDLTQDPTVLVKAHIVQPQQPINEFVFTSPIDNSVGAVLRQLDVTGVIDTVFDLTLPLSGTTPQVSGVVTLDNNDLLIKSIDVDITQLSGAVTFTDGNVFAQSLQGVLYQQPISFDVLSKPLDDYYGLEIDLSSQWHTNKMPQQWQAYLNPYIDGSLDWQGKVTLKINEDNVYYQSSVKSPMTGLELKLPKPLDKYVNQQEDLIITTDGHINEGLFNLALGSRAEVLARIVTEPVGISIPAMTLLVGRKFQVKDDIATDGLTLNIDLDTLAIGEWQSFIGNIVEEQHTQRFFPPLQRINARVKQINVLGQEFDNVVLKGAKYLGNWAVDFDSVQGKGEINIFDDLMQKGIRANLEHLSIVKPKESQVKGATSRQGLRNIAPLAFDCQQCSVLGVNLGQVSFNTQPHLQGIAINNIKVNTQTSTLDASAIWGVDSQGEYTSVTGTLLSESFETLLKAFEYSSNIRDSDLQADFDFMWRDSLYTPSTDTLSGEFIWELGEGHIAEVSDQGARILSLFSLDSLRRKLVLDFRDVFQKGIFFNNFKGHFDINDGIAVTTDTYMDGVAGSVNVQGSVNLSSQELDYYISFAPRLFSNLPVIAGVVASEPHVFVLTFALTKVLEPIVDVISQVNWKLSGTVDKPSFIEIERKNKKYQVPAHILDKVIKSDPEIKPDPVIKPDKEDLPIQGVHIPHEQHQTNSGTTRI